VSNLDSISGSSGLILIVTGVVLVAILITLITGYLAHWVPVAAGIAIGILAVKTINQ